MIKFLFTTRSILRTAILPTFLLVIMTLSFGKTNAQCTINDPTRLFNITHQFGLYTPGFMLYLPADYNTAPPGKKYPLLMFWSGQGQIGSFCTLLSNTIPYLINQGGFPQTQEYIVIAPYIDNPYQFNPSNRYPTADIDAILTHAITSYKVNTQKIYMTGFSFGSYLLMDYASTGNQYARKLAAIAPVANCFIFDQTRADNLAASSVDLWGLQCPGDGPGSTCFTQWLIDYVDEINEDHPNQAKFTPFSPCQPDNHDIWSNVYNLFYEEGGLDIYEWLFQFSSNFTLPAKIKDYRARIDKSKVIVEWTTTQESNVDRFTIERSLPGQAFEKISTVTAAGNSSVDKKYSITDDQPFGGSSLYRLVSVDKDGRTEYFETKRVTIPTQWGAKAFVASPIKGQLQVYFNLQRSTKVTIDLVDLNGRQLRTLQKGFNPGISQHTLDVSSLAAGVYVVRVRSDDFSISKKITIN